MSDTKALNNRLDYVERQRVAAETATVDMQRQRDDARRQADYYRKECRLLAQSGNAVRGIQETLARRAEAHRRDLIPGDRIHAAALIECEAVLAIVNSIVEGPK